VGGAGGGAYVMSELVRKMARVTHLGPIHILHMCKNLRDTFHSAYLGIEICGIPGLYKFCIGMNLVQPRQPEFGGTTELG
jgi:hypothetical protein